MTNWGWPQWVVIAFFAMKFLLNIVKHDEPIKGDWNAGSALFWICAAAYILNKGGFFTCQ